MGIQPDAQHDIAEVFEHGSELIVVSGGGLRRGNRYVVRVVQDGAVLARQTGLIDGRGRPVRQAAASDCGGVAIRGGGRVAGAFLAHGSLTEPGRSGALGVTCPGPEAALALVRAARRLGVGAKAREVRGVDRVVIRDGEAVSSLLTHLGAHDAVLAWEGRRLRREVRGTANASPTTTTPTCAGLPVPLSQPLRGSSRRLRSSARKTCPEHLLQAGRLRVELKRASLEELGQLSDPFWRRTRWLAVSAGCSQWRTSTRSSTGSTTRWRR